MLHIIEDTRQKAAHHSNKHAFFEQVSVKWIRCKLPFGDYAPVPPVSIDTKENMDEIAANICGAEHKRFIAECKAAKEAGCQLIVLVENELNIKTLPDVARWVNPRTRFSPKCVQGPRLRKAMETISERYGVQFQFCHPDETGKRIMEILKEYGYYNN